MLVGLPQMASVLADDYQRKMGQIDPNKKPAKALVAHDMVNVSTMKCTCPILKCSYVRVHVRSKHGQCDRLSRCMKCFCTLVLRTQVVVLPILGSLCVLSLFGYYDATKVPSSI